MSEAGLAGSSLNLTLLSFTGFPKDRLFRRMGALWGFREVSSRKTANVAFLIYRQPRWHFHAEGAHIPLTFLFLQWALIPCSPTHTPDHCFSSYSLCPGVRRVSTALVKNAASLVVTPRVTGKFRPL